MKKLFKLNNPRNNQLQLVRSAAGRALYVFPDGRMIRSYGLDIYQSNDTGCTWKLLFRLPKDFKYRICQPIRLLCRLFRQEVRAFETIPDIAYIATTRSGVFYSKDGDLHMRRALIYSEGVNAQPPMTICTNLSNKIIWGEYYGNNIRRPVRIFASHDFGQTFHVVHKFDAGAVRHVHNIIYDKDLNKFWVLCGDFGEEPGIGLLDYDYRSFEWVVKGHQKFRAVCAFIAGNQFIYATDTEFCRNGIYALDKVSGKIDQIEEIDGSCIYSTRCGKYYIISTTAEPLKWNSDKPKGISSIWISNNLLDWRRLISAKKDIWPYKYFQYGSHVLPRGYSNKCTLMISGQAIQGMDGSLFTVDLEQLENF